MMVRASLVLLVAVLPFACKKSPSNKTGNRGSENSSAASSLLPKDAEIQSLSLDETNQVTYVSRYEFEPEKMILKGTWERDSIEGISTHAEDSIPVNELEWDLVKRNVQLLKPLTLDTKDCGKMADGVQQSIRVAYTLDAKEQSFVVATQASLPYLCADHYVADATFATILNAIKQKLPTPSQSAFRPKAS